MRKVRRSSPLYVAGIIASGLIVGRSLPPLTIRFDGSSPPVPGWAPGLVLGTRGADELALADQRVTPRALTDLRHHFRYPRLRAALDHELGAETVPAVL